MSNSFTFRIGNQSCPALVMLSERASIDQKPPQPYLFVSFHPDHFTNPPQTIPPPLPFSSPSPLTSHPFPPFHTISPQMRPNSQPIPRLSCRLGTRVPLSLTIALLPSLHSRMLTFLLHVLCHWTLTLRTGKRSLRQPNNFLGAGGIDWTLRLGDV